MVNSPPPPMGVMPAPPGQVADFSDDYTSLQMALIIANISTYAIATVFLFLRMYTSAFINRRTDLGDCKEYFCLTRIHVANVVHSLVFLFASWGIGAASIACTMIGEPNPDSCDVENIVSQ
jgi:hypothetical protein